MSEHVKRKRLVEELLFWLYDGFVIPLLRVSSWAGTRVPNVVKDPWVECVLRDRDGNNKKQDGILSIRRLGRSLQTRVAVSET